MAPNLGVSKIHNESITNSPTKDKNSVTIKSTLNHENMNSMYFVYTFYTYTCGKKGLTVHRAIEVKLP